MYFWRWKVAAAAIPRQKSGKKRQHIEISSCVLCRPFPFFQSLSGSFLFLVCSICFDGMGHTTQKLNSRNQNRKRKLKLFKFCNFVRLSVYLSDSFFVFLYWQVKRSEWSFPKKLNEYFNLEWPFFGKLQSSFFILLCFE